MSYQVLARKWRPKSFATLVGQEHVVRALTHALDQNRLHHAYLFTGTRGVGKTTLARIMAKALNCESRRQFHAMRQVCGACAEIDSGRFIDYIELDAASNRGVDDMTQLLERATYAPTIGRYKVYVIDEVHQLSGHAFNAMLKTLEEPPEHVKFILATTDPQKIPVTVLSRCLQFNLKQMPQTQIVDHLSRVSRSGGRGVRSLPPCAISPKAPPAACAMRCRCSTRPSPTVPARMEDEGRASDAGHRR
jgi:DNA polymerase-3 subunit gamma/tau